MTLRVCGRADRLYGQYYNMITSIRTGKGEANGLGKTLTSSRAYFSFVTHEMSSFEKSIWDSMSWINVPLMMGS